ncbi:aspartate carbamoyltransferase catalytic subunit [Caldalkalibacillus mannanilyticus]|uniref:aspartate carbamoyltransferase catalytic subunit n=1 Tax=Caldalkalibacillus mannanilyticus TaxID=1418 RepID=UPI000468AB4D|nr:aspartate carbamoyltransferase catalytic subunit [Caldalkalibacillus mannanilyticus]
MTSLIGLKNLEALEIEQILTRAQEFINEPLSSIDILKNRFVVNLFFENSTRTRFSFEVAEKRLGAHVLNFQESSSSTQKGETIYDTIKTIESMGVEAAVIRHSQNGLLEDLQGRLQVKLINAGIGNEEHPTQALLDMLTMKQEFGKIAGLKVAIIGDLKHSRVASSNFYGLKKLGAEVILSGPDAYKPYDPELREGSTWLPIEDAIGEADVVMMLRIQHERHQDRGLDISQNEYHNLYGLTEKRAKFMKKGAIIMHPAPFNRDVEIASCLIESPKSRIFKQVSNGVAVRMAVLEKALIPSKKEMLI